MDHYIDALEWPSSLEVTHDGLRAVDVNDALALAVKGCDDRLAARQVGLDACRYRVAEDRVAAQRGKQDVRMREIARHALRRPMAEKVELPKLASRDLFLDPRPH